MAPLGKLRSGNRVSVKLNRTKKVGPIFLFPKCGYPWFGCELPVWRLRCRRQLGSQPQKVSLVLVNMSRVHSNTTVYLCGLYINVLYTSYPDKKPRHLQIDTGSRRRDQHDQKGSPVQATGDCPSILAMCDEMG